MPLSNREHFCTSIRHGKAVTDDVAKNHFQGSKDDIHHIFTEHIVIAHDRNCCDPIAINLRDDGRPDLERHLALPSSSTRFGKMLQSGRAVDFSTFRK